MMSMAASTITLLLVALLHSTTAAPSIGSCPDGSQPHNCKVDPCQLATCPIFPPNDVVCLADYCGGCNARWYIRGDLGLEVTTICQGDGKCPDGSRPVNCFVNPCQFASCPGVPGATCRPDYCGGCNARWYLGDQEVTDTCVPVDVKCSIPGQIYSTCAPCTGTCANPNPICTLQCVEGCHCPRGTVLDRNRCISPKECLVTRPPVPECSIPGQIYSTCGSACTATCANPNPICTLQCVVGCHCPSGTVLDRNRCIPFKKCLQLQDGIRIE